MLPTDTQYLLDERSRKDRLDEAQDLGREIERNEERIKHGRLTAQQKSDVEERNFTIEHLLRECYDLCGSEPTFKVFSREMQQAWPSEQQWHRYMPMPTMDASHQNGQASRYSAATTSVDIAATFARAWGERGSIFVIAPAPHGITINGLKESQGLSSRRFGHELEVCLPGPVPVEDIIAVIPCDSDGQPKYASTVLNPHYMSPADHASEYGGQLDGGSGGDLHGSRQSEDTPAPAGAERDP